MIFRQLITVLREKADGREILPVWHDVTRWYLEHDYWRKEFEKARKAFSYRNIAQPVEKDKIRKLFGESFTASVSRLERYNSCPFAFYVQYGLRAKERKVFEFTPPDAGTFLHTAVELFSKAVHNSMQKNAESGMGETPAEPVTWRTFDKKWCEEKVSEIIDELLRKMAGSGYASSRRMIILARRLKRVLFQGQSGSSLNISAGAVLNPLITKQASETAKNIHLLWLNWTAARKYCYTGVLTVLTCWSHRTVYT